MKKKKVFSVILNIALVVIILFAGALIYRNSVYKGVYVDGSSMSPTLRDHEYGYLNKTSGSIKNATKKRFKIVIIDISENHGLTIIKRVVGLPNETIRVESQTGDLYVNGELVEQTFISEEARSYTCTGSIGIACDKDFVVPSDSVYVLGDNRGNSSDSERLYGAIKIDYIIGVLKVIFKSCSDFNQNTCSYISPRWY